MQVKIEKNELVIRMPIKSPPEPSNSGKTMLVASTHGAVPTTVEVDGKPLIVSLNAYTRK